MKRKKLLAKTGVLITASSLMIMTAAPMAYAETTSETTGTGNQTTDTSDSGTTDSAPESIEEAETALAAAQELSSPPADKFASLAMYRAYNSLEQTAGGWKCVNRM